MAAVFGSGLLAAAVASCGTATLNTASAEKKIARAVAQVTGAQVAVTCPQNVPVRKGRVTICKARGADGTGARVRVVQTDNQGGVHISSPLMHTALVERQIAADASRRLGFVVSVTCPKLVEAGKGSRVTCHVSDNRGARAPVYVTIRNSNGSYTYRIPPR